MLKRKELHAIAARSHSRCAAAAAVVPDEVFGRSRLARCGERAVKAAILVRLAQSMLLFVITMLMMTFAHAARRRVTSARASRVAS